MRMLGPAHVDLRILETVLKKKNEKPLLNFKRESDVIQFTFSKLTFTAVQKMDWRKPFRR